MVGADEVGATGGRLSALDRELVQAGRDALGETPRVHEDERAAVCHDLVEQARVDVGPDARDRLRAAVAGFESVGAVRAARGRGIAGELGEVFDRHDHLDVELLARSRVDDRDRSGLEATVDFARATEESRDLVEWPLGRRETDPLGRLGGQRFETLEREREVRAPLRRGQAVDLVHDDRVHVAERFARLRGEHQVQGLGRRDEDVGRSSHEQTSLP